MTTWDQGEIKSKKCDNSTAWKLVINIVDKLQDYIFQHYAMVIILFVNPISRTLSSQALGGGGGRFVSVPSRLTKFTVKNQKKIQISEHL